MFKTINFKFKISLVCLFYALLTISAFAFAQTEDPQTDDNTGAEQREEKVTEQETDQEANQRDSQEDSQQNNDNNTNRPPVSSNSGDFVPSEEISEDLSVSFPVDI